MEQQLVVLKRAFVTLYQAQCKLLANSKQIKQMSKSFEKI